MNDLYYIEYKPELMLSDSMDMDAETELAHRRLCDFIWRMDKAPKADNEFLKQFTKTRPADWGRVKRGLIEKGWTEVGGLFLHKAAIETLNVAKVKYADQCNQTAAANAKKTGVLKLMVCERDSVTGIVSLKVTTSVTSSVTLPVTTRQPEREPEPEPGKNPPSLSKSSLEKGSGENPEDLVATGSREIPDEDQAVVMTMNAGIPEAYVRYVHRGWYATGGKNGAGVLTKDWLSYVTGRWKNEQTEWHNGTHRGNRRQAAGGAAGAASPSVAVMNHTAEHTEVQKRIAVLLDRDPHMPMTAKEKEDLRKLKARRSELRKLMGWQVED